jgi:SagB-type dehydrogenase family enzyme
MQQDIKSGREFLKDRVRQQIDFSQTDQYRGLPPPPIEKPVPEAARRIALPEIREITREITVPLSRAIGKRRSRRNFTEKRLGLEGLSFLLWACQGIQRQMGPGTAIRTVPSAGCRHALETYLWVMNVETLEPGLYRYLPMSHELVFVSPEQDMPRRISEALLGQDWAGRSAVVFIWTAIPYRMEWRYSLAAHKVIALDAGHAGQNLYLACEALGAGTCTIAAYDQDHMDRLLRVDGEDEFTVYLAPVGMTR